MPRTKRAQILMEPDEYSALAEMAQQKKISVAELIRKAVKEYCFARPDKSKEIVEEIIQMNLPVQDWQQVELDISESHRGSLP
ncbi:MAG: hypothetical protein HYU36_08935 [Planctomycetes bacterium]|nr:hypothetical protein [Planctomycetota bacterium]